MSCFILSSADVNLVNVFFPFSDAFDFQFGAVILRLKEGLDVSHIQGQGIRHLYTYKTWFQRSI